jgi:hypothetical protein
MARDRDYDDEYADDRREDEYDDRPRRRRGGGGSGPLDNMFAKTNIVVLILFGICCGLIAFALSLVAFLTGKDPQAKSNAMIVMIISGILSVLGLILNLTGALGGIGGR